MSVSKGAPRVTTITSGSPYSYGRSLYNFDMKKEIASNVYVNGKLVGGKAYRVRTYAGPTENSGRPEIRELDRVLPNKYDEPEVGPPPEWPFHDFNYGDVYG